MKMRLSTKRVKNNWGVVQTCFIIRFYARNGKQNALVMPCMSLGITAFLYICLVICHFVFPYIFRLCRYILPPYTLSVYGWLVG